MKDHKVVVIPAEGNLERRVNVAEFARSQDLRQPPRSPGSRRTKLNFDHSRSPARRRLPKSRDIVQEVYDRMGVNYVRGQSSVELRDDNEPGSKKADMSKFSYSSPSKVPKAPGIPADVVVKPSNSFNKQSNALTVDTRNEAEAEDRQERNSVRSTRSVKSLLSEFGGGKNVSSKRSVGSRDSFHELESPHFRRDSLKSKINYVDATTTEEVKEKIIDCRNDNDIDSNMSIISLDESQWTKKKQTSQEEEEKKIASRISDFQSRRTSFQSTTSIGSGTMANKYNYATQPSSRKPNGHYSKTTDSSSKIFDETVNQMIEKKIEAKISELNSFYEEKFRRLEEDTNSRLKELETKFKESINR